MRLVLRERNLAVGTLQICSDNHWQTVCSDTFDKQDLKVACRALGFTDFEAISDLHRFLPTSTIVKESPFNQVLGCSGQEKNFSKCGIIEPLPIPSNESVCLETRIQCLGILCCQVKSVPIQHSLCSARPLILFNPVAGSHGVLVVEQYRHVTLQCIIDASSHPPVSFLFTIPCRYGDVLHLPASQLASTKLASNFTQICLL